MQTTAQWLVILLAAVELGAADSCCLFHGLWDEAGSHPAAHHHAAGSDEHTAGGDHPQSPAIDCDDSGGATALLLTLMGSDSGKAPAQLNDLLPAPVWAKAIRVPIPGDLQEGIFSPLKHPPKSLS